MSTVPRKKVAVIGSGPAGLMAASHAALPADGPAAQVTVFERRPGLGRKLLIAGSSGLNISYDAPLEDFLEHYRARDPHCAPRLLEAIRAFLPDDWLNFVRGLGHEVFVGTSGRWFVREMKASGLLQSWTTSLKKAGVTFKTGTEISTREDLERVRSEFDAVVLAVGGGSWESEPPRWPALLESYGVKVHPFVPSNVGYEVEFPPALLAEAEGKPIKNCTLTTALGSKQGELVITRYGLEGTPVYFTGTPGPATLCLRPDLDLNAWMALLRTPVRENLSPMRKLQRVGGLSEGALALVYHLTPPEVRSNLTQLGLRVHAFPLLLTRPRPLEEAISSRGGVCWSELDSNLMLRKLPGVYCAGEMIHWDAPTGGFLIQASVSLGARAGAAAAAGASGA